MRTNYILIDYENVSSPTVLDVLAQGHFKVIVFVGASQPKVTYEVASTLQKLGDRATYIKISSNGSNALDFHVAYYIGQLTIKEPDAYFHIISKDKGFDPLIAHLKEHKIFASRSNDITEISIIKSTTANTVQEKIAIVLTKLSQLVSGKPRTVRTLSSTINALFQKSLSSEDLTKLIQELVKQKVIEINDTKVRYLPD
jgi:PIN domain